MKHRRGPGEGSVVKRKDGRWSAIVSLGYEGGKRRRRTIYGRSAKEVREELTKTLRDNQMGLPVRTGGQTLATYLASWLENRKPSIRPRTYEFYDSMVRLHIIPELGKVRLERLAPEHIQPFLNRKLKSGLSAMTVKHIRAVLGIALKQATKWNLAARNAAALTDGPKIEKEPVKPLSADEARKLLDTLAGNPLEAFFSVSLAVGLRRGEALGLRWTDVDLDTGILHVNQSLQRVERKLQLLPLKTKSSRRPIPLPALVVAALRRQRARQAEYRLAAGPEWKGAVDNLVFTTKRGTAIEPRNADRTFRAALKAAGLARTKLHNLRHTAASLLLPHVHPKVVQEMLGHSRIGTTLDIYSHVTTSLMNEAADKMDAILAGAKVVAPAT